MTSAELARQIEERERRAESKAAVQRALDFAARKRAEERARIDDWLGKEPPPPPQFIKRVGRPAKRYAALGKNLTLTQWSSDTGISVQTLRTRINSGWPIEIALQAPLGMYFTTALKEYPR